MRRPLLAFALVLSACASAPAAPRPSTPVVWRSQVLTAHPLVGKVWEVARARFVDAAEVEKALGAADFAVLGEKHDNEDHHALQARMLASMVAAGKKPTVAFEMIDVGQQEALDAYLAKPGASTDGVGAALSWEERGWPTFAWYAPIVQVALGAHLRLLGTNLSRAEVKGLVHQGLSALPAGEAERLGLDRPLPEAQEAELREEMAASHCGMLPEGMLAPMALAQRARDARMAARMLAAAKSGPVVLIAGGGHARKDRAVPAWLSAHAPSARVVSLAWLEVDPGSTGPGQEPYDFVWYTPRADDEDPCAKMK